MLLSELYFASLAYATLHDGSGTTPVEVKMAR